MTRPSVFIGSSTEGLDVARAVQYQLKDDAQVTIWNEAHFPLSGSVLETLVNSLQQFDFAILILSADDLIISRGDASWSPRENVMFELGLFMGARANANFHRF